LNWKETGMNRKPVNVDVLKKKYAMESTMGQLLAAVTPLNPLKGT
jgi:hypothetical protein